MKKRSICWILIWILIVQLMYLPQTIEAKMIQTPDLAPNAKAAILMDANSGRVLYGKNIDQQMLIASLTKIMTAIIAIEQGDLNELVTVGPNAVGVEGSSIYLKQGEKLPLSTLLYGLMLQSGNDAAVAIAEHIGGSVEGFVYLMNEKAEYLGLENTHFANPHGLDHPKHYSSARDLAVLTSYALKNETFREIVKTEVKVVPWPGEKWHRKIYNKNKMLRLYRWADGVKTGYTKRAGRTLVSSATQGEERLVAVTLNDGDDWRESMAMFEYGFKHFDLVPILKKGQVVIEKPIHKDDKTFHVVAGTTFQYSLTEEEKKKITIEPVITVPERIVDHSNMQVGNARIYVDGEWIGSVPLMTAEIKPSSIFQTFNQLLLLVSGRGEVL